MARFSFNQNAFLAGELSPNFWGRTDLEQYRNGCKEVYNKIVLPQGGATRRPGTQFITDDFNGSAIPENTRLIPFIFSQEETYLVAISNTNNGYNSQGIVVINTQTQEKIGVSVALSNYFSFTNWADMEDLNKIQYAQNADVLVLVSPTNFPLFLIREDATTFRLRDIWQSRTAFAASRRAYEGTDTTILQKLSPSDPPTSSAANYANLPFRDLENSAMTITFSAVGTGTRTMTQAGLPKFPAPWNTPGNIIRFTKGGVTGVYRVTSYNSGTDTITISVIKALPNVTGATSDEYEVNDWSPLYGWPETVTFFDQRAVYGGSFSKPDTVWASQAGDYMELMVTRNADDSNFNKISNDRPFSFAMAESEVNKIQWLRANRKTIACGTLGAEFTILGANPDDSLGPLNFSFFPESNIGSSKVQAVRNENSIVFVDRSGQKVREFVYSREENAFRATDLTYPADHMLDKAYDYFTNPELPTIVSVQHQKVPWSVIWCLDSNGQFFGITRERDFGVSAWHFHQLGGVGSADDEPVQIKSFCVVPGYAGSIDEVWFVVKRYINGESKISIEKLSRPYKRSSLLNTSTSIDDKPVYMDAARLFNPYTDFTFCAGYRTSIDGDAGEGSLSGLASGGAAIANGRLDLTGGTVKYVSYSAANIPMTSKARIRFKWIPNYNGSPASDRTLISFGADPANNNNYVRIYHATSGLMRVDIYSSTGTGPSGATKSVSAVAGQTYEIEVEIDDNSAQIQVDGSGLTSSFDVITRTSTLGFFYVGTDRTAANSAESSIYDLLINDTDLIEFDDTYMIAGKVFGLDYYEGEVVSVLADGLLLSDKTVDRGYIDLGAEYNEALVGLNYTARVIPLGLEAGSVIGSALGANKRTNEVTIKFHKTVGASFGPNTDNLEDIDFAPEHLEDGDPIPMFTGEKTRFVAADYEREQSIVIQQSSPLPCTVVSLISKGVTYD